MDNPRGIGNGRARRRVAGAGIGAPPLGTGGLEAVDFDATIALLKAANVPFRMGPLETAVRHMAIISDPAGNGLIIHKRKPVRGRCRF